MRRFVAIATLPTSRHMDNHPQSAWWYVTGTAVLLAEGIRDLRHANASHFAGWGSILAAAFLALASLAAWRQTRPSTVSSAATRELRIFGTGGPPEPPEGRPCRRVLE